MWRVRYSFEAFVLEAVSIYRITLAVNPFVNFLLVGSGRPQFFEYS